MKQDLSIASVVYLALLVMNMLYIFFGIRFMFLKGGNGSKRNRYLSITNPYGLATRGFLG